MYSFISVFFQVSENNQLGSNTFKIFNLICDSKSNIHGKIFKMTFKQFQKYKIKINNCAFNGRLFSLEYSIPLCDYTIIYLSIPLLMDIWVIPSLGYFLWFEYGLSPSKFL